VNEWTGLFLAIMAASLAVMAVIQIGLIVVALRVAKEVSAATTQLKQEIVPLVQSVNRLTDEAARTTSLVALQVERVDGMMATAATRLDETMGIVQSAVSGPVGQGIAAVKAFRVAMSVVRDWKSRRRSHAHDEDDALFVG
jgi:hypothetical protein